MTEEVGASATYQVAYVSTRRPGKWWWPTMENEHRRRERLTKEQEDLCANRSQEGLRLVNVVPVLSSGSFQGSWTEGVWLYFADADAGRS